jgi:hypothetical protein
VPTGNDEVVKDAEYTPGDTSVKLVAVPKTAAPFLNSTVPVGVKDAGTLIVAVNVTGEPKVGVVVLRTRVVVVMPRFTIKD